MHLASTGPPRRAPRKTIAFTGKPSPDISTISSNRDPSHSQSHSNERSARISTFISAGVTRTNKTPEYEPEPRIHSAQEVLKLFEMLDGRPLEKNCTLKQLIKSARIQTGSSNRNLMAAFNFWDTTSKFQDSGTGTCFDECNNEIDLSPPLLSMSDILSSDSSIFLSKGPSSSGGGHCSEDTNEQEEDENHGFIEYERLKAEAISAFEKLHSVYNEHVVVKTKLEKEKTLPTSLLDSVRDSFERVAPLINSMPEAAAEVAELINATKTIGIPCPLEKRDEIVESLHRLGKIYKRCQWMPKTNGFPVNLNWDEALLNSAGQNIQILELNLISLEQALEETEQQLKLRNDFLE